MVTEKWLFGNSKLLHKERPMYTFTYWDNENGWHAKKVFECQAASITEADQKYEVMTGMNPRKQRFVGCTSKKVQEEKDA